MKHKHLMIRGNTSIVPLMMSSSCMAEATPLVCCQVIIKLSDQVTACLSDPRHSGSPSGGGLDSQTFKQFQQDIENLKVK